jgi:hypothetical protein
MTTKNNKHINIHSIVLDNPKIKHEIKNMSNYSSEKLSKIKIKNNFTLTKLHQITKVNRGVLERFLDGGKINHIDYLKIIKEFPQIQEQQYSDKKVLEVAPINMFGAVEQQGYVRGMYLNESKVFYLDSPLKTIFTNELIALHDTFSANKFVCIYKPNKIKFTRQDVDHYFLIKTKTDCWYGICKQVDKEFVLHCHNCQECLSVINYKKDDIVEIFEMLATINGRWSELKDKSFTSVIKK